MRRGWHRARIWIAIVGIPVYVVVIGYVTTGLRLVAAGLPAGHGLFVVPFWHSVLTGLIVTAIAAFVLAFSCGAAFFASLRRWDFHGPDWEQIVKQGGFRPAWKALNADDDSGTQQRAQRAARGEMARASRHVRRQRRLATAAGAVHLKRAAERRRLAAQSAAPAAMAAGQRWTPDGLDDRLLRILAGFNLIVLSAVLGLGVSQVVAEFASAWWAVLGSGLATALLVHWLLTTIGPLAVAPWLHDLVWAFLILLALLSSPPIGVAIATGVMISIWGRRLVRKHGSGPSWDVIWTPLPLLVAFLYTVAGVAYLAMPPISFSGVKIETASAEYVGGQLSRSGSTVHLVLCTPLADATSTAAHLHDVTLAAAVKPAVTTNAAFDQGQRPSLIALLPSLVGIDWPRALLLPNLKARRPTCANGPPSTTTPGWEDPALGSGAIAGPAPAGGRATDGEPPIGQTADPRIAALARQFQPTIEVTVADYFWPVSVEAVLAGVGPHGQRSCLVKPPGTPVCTGITTPPSSGQPADYLRFPSTNDLDDLAVTTWPTAQFRAFENGQRTVTGSLHHWLADPGVLDPWRSAQIYFYYAGPVHFSGLAGRLPPWPGVSAFPAPLDAVAPSDGLIGLQYWFFYPYNYYPVVVRTSLMNGAPIAADAGNVDLHQGDWEHMTVLLDERTLKPVALYMARHASEGQFYRWGSPLVQFSGDHPVVQAAIGGHPTYPNRCLEHKRSAAVGLLSDWIVCGSGRFVFRASTTPLVDLASPTTSWSCWQGHFGEAKGNELVGPTSDAIAKDIAKYVDVAGPVSPLWQAENGSLDYQHPDQSYGVCDAGAAAAEHGALQGSSGALLTKLYGK